MNTIVPLVPDRRPTPSTSPVSIQVVQSWNESASAVPGSGATPALTTSAGLHRRERLSHSRHQVREPRLPELPPPIGKLFGVPERIDRFDLVETRALLERELRPGLGAEDLHGVTAVVEVGAREAHRVEEDAIDRVSLAAAVTAVTR